MSFEKFINELKSERTGFNHYLEPEYDRRYYHMNTLSYYYDKMAEKERNIKKLSKKVDGYDKEFVKVISETNEKIKELSLLWDVKMKNFPWIEYMTEQDETWVI